MALSALEQLLRGWASHQQIEHVKDGIPLPWAKWGPSLPCSPALHDLLDDLYEPTKINLRNRIMHGGLIEVAAMRMETTIRTAASVAAGGPLILATTLTPNPFSTENIAVICLDALIAVDSEVAAGLTDADRAWESSVALSTDEARWGYRDLKCDFLAPVAVAEAFRRRLSRYVSILAPGVQNFFQVGFHGWIGGPFQSRHFVQRMFQTLVFEALFRLTAHLMNESVLQTSQSGGDFRIQYRMLDKRTGNLCDDRHIERLISHLSESDRQTARRVVALAVRIRDAVAHGALPVFDEERWKGEGHILVKATQLLMEAGIHHMTKEAAYYRLKQRWTVDPSHCDPVDDWVEGEKQIERRLFDQH